MIWKTEICRLEKLHSRLNARTHQFPVLGKKASFGGNFVMNACVASVCPILNFYEAIMQ